MEIKHYMLPIEIIGLFEEYMDVLDPRARDFIVVSILHCSKLVEVIVEVQYEVF